MVLREMPPVKIKLTAVLHARALMIGQTTAHVTARGPMGGSRVFHWSRKYTLCAYWLLLPKYCRFDVDGTDG